MRQVRTNLLKHNSNQLQLEVPNVHKRHVVQSNQAQTETPTTFGEDLTELLLNFNLDCYRWLAQPDISRWEVFIWLIIHIVHALLTCLLLKNLYVAYETNPTVTTLSDTLYPIGSVPFPAISICNNNRISLHAATGYARELSIKSRNSTSQAYFLQQLRLLGKLFDNEAGDETEMNSFQAILNEFDVFDEILPYDTRQHMEKLSPSCEHMMVRCIWRGEQRPCMENHVMFEQRSTQYGHCCTFNYVRPDFLEQKVPQSYFVNDTGPELGLILLLDANSTDYFYPLYNFFGFIIQVFNPNEFPDVPSGSVSEQMVMPGHETFIRIDSKTFTTEEETRRYTSDKRGCLFPDELPQQFGDRYKRSDCVVNCRMASIVALCGCQMFFLPFSTAPASQGGSHSVPLCTLEHLQCLNQFRGSNVQTRVWIKFKVNLDLVTVKWSTMLLNLEKVAGLEHELENGLYCPICLPSCADTSYMVTANHLPLSHTFRNYSNIMTGVTDVSEVALVRIYLGQPETWLYKQTVSINWFDLIGNLGGLCGVITGFSMVALAEVLFFLAKQAYRFYRRKMASEMFPTTGYNEQVFHIIP